VKPQSLQKCLNLTRLSLHRLQRAVVDRNASDLHIFSSHFFTTLLDEGTDAVRSWTAKKNIDIFQKKLIFIPINQSLHWSLCVIVNPGAIVNASSDEGSSDDPLACMIFLDSLKAHRKGLVRIQVMKWLNAEWNRLKKEEDGTHTGSRFTKQSFPIIDPVGKFASFNRVAFSVLQLAYSHIISFLSPLPRQRMGLWSFRLSLCLFHVSASPSRFQLRRSRSWPC
jgi:hypothetical protein